MNSMHFSKPNVYKTLVLLWRQSRPGLGLLPINPTIKGNIDRYLRLIVLARRVWLTRKERWDPERTADLQRSLTNA